MTPCVSVIVCTINRPDQIAQCVQSILRNPDRDFELVVIDQSATSVRQQAMQEVGSDRRLRWLSSEVRGLSRSRNIGLAETRAPVIAFTDDDCRVPEDWVAGIRAAFAADPDLAMQFGAVVLRPEDRLKGYAAEFEPTATLEFRGALPDAGQAWGVGANMSMRRMIFEQLDTFDLALGAGSLFVAGEEIDLTLRAVSGGLKVRQTADSSVIHLGIREGAAAARLMRGYGVGLGATLAKHIRLRTPGAFGLLAGWLALHGRRSVRNALRGHRNPGFGLVASVLLGVVRSYRLGIDRRRGLYRYPPPS
jgi:glycosyltransferase involved in cell wall biosynthesis